MPKRSLKSALVSARTLYRKGDTQQAIATLESALLEWKSFEQNKDTLWNLTIAVLNTLRQKLERPMEAVSVTEKDFIELPSSSPDSRLEGPIWNENRYVNFESLDWKSSLEKLKELREETRLLFSKMEKEKSDDTEPSINTLTSKQSYTLRRLGVLDRRCRYALIALTG